MIFICKILIISAFCVGLKKMTEENMILNKPFNWLYESDMPDWIFKPLIGCHYCFASLWGSIVYWIVSIYGCHEVMINQLLWMWPVICICCVFTNGLLYGILKHAEALAEKA